MQLFLIVVLVTQQRPYPPIANLSNVFHVLSSNLHSHTLSTRLVNIEGYKQIISDKWQPVWQFGFQSFLHIFLLLPIDNKVSMF